MPKSCWLALVLGAFSLACSAQADPDSDHEQATGGAAGSSGVGGSGTAGTLGGGGTTSAGGTTTGGAGATGGASGGSTGGGSTGGSASAGSGGGGGGPHVIGSCDALPAVGTWEETTPAEVKAKFPEKQYGTIALVMDPTNYATMYFGTQQIGIYKSTDCGATFVHINTGENGAVLDGGFQWGMAIDPIDSEVVYANSGYSSSNGAWKSTNGGVDWQQFWPPADGSLPDKVEYNFVHKVRIDPYDHEHVLVSFHAQCVSPYNKNCFGETHDAGETWQLVNGDSAWHAGGDQTIWFLTDSNSWLYSSQDDGIWRTSNAGEDWTVVNAGWGGHNGGQLYRAADGTFYLSSPIGLFRSVDGVAWTDTNAGQGLIGIAGDGANMYASHGPYAQDPYEPYITSPENDGQTWAAFDSPALSAGGWELAYDSDHHILFSSNGTAGFWRVVTQ